MSLRIFLYTYHEFFLNVLNLSPFLIQDLLRHNDISILILVLEVVMTPNMGYGVYAAFDIPAWDLLDEYMGQLITTRMAMDDDFDFYSFEMPGIGASTAKHYGNWTRFVNHTCVNANVSAQNTMLGGRRTVVFQALRNIAAGEELLLHYGPGYFSDEEGEILCRCADFPSPHVPPAEEDAAPGNNSAASGPPAPRSFGMQLRSSVSSRNEWITTTKSWMGQLRPSGSSRWTTLHWRLLEQLIRRRRNQNDWLNKYGYAQLPPSTGDPLVGQRVTRGRVSMRIREWHVDVAKAFRADNVCGITLGQPWDMNVLIVRIFAVVIAARRRMTRENSRRRDRSTTPPEPINQATPARPPTQQGVLPTPPATVPATVPGVLPTPPATIARPVP